MSDVPLEPPLPSDWGGQPPPPGLAQKLVAKAGAVVYESGNSMFDESVLVYVAQLSGLNRSADFEIVDHLGRGLGWTRRVPGKGRWTANRSVGVYDGGGTKVLHANGRRSFGFSVELSGVAAATVKLEGRSRLTLTSGRESYGALSGGGWLGYASSHLVLIDHRDTEVGSVRRIRFGRLGAHRTHYVVSFKPGLRGELRRLAVAAPVIIKLWEAHNSN